VRRILLVNPHETEQLGFSNPPLGLLYIAGMLLRHDFEVCLVDGCLDGREAIQRAIREFRPDLVGVTCLTPGRKKALEVGRMAKEIHPGTKVLFGGAHPTIMYSQMMTHYREIDYIALGEGEHTCLEVAQGIPPSEIRGLVYRDHAGKIVRNSQRPHVENLDSLPFPAWHLIDLKRYPPRNDGYVLRVNGVNLEKEPRISVIFSRGCKGHCSFCSTWWIWRGWRHRSPENMTDELELLYTNFGIRHFCFSDDAMTVDQKAAESLCNEIVRRGMKIAFHITTRTDCVDAVLLEKLKKAGCYSIAYGMETASPKLLSLMNKENDAQTARHAIRLTKDTGISVTALFIVGNVGETDETIEETIRFIRDTKPDIVGATGSLWIFPGTALYQKCKQAGFIDDEFWLSDEPYKIYTLEHSLDQLNRYHRRFFWNSIQPTRMVIRKLRKILGA
jgi:radical SAM superfamily enzyme YgiQ (UPF0313 family)